MQYRTRALVSLLLLSISITGLPLPVRGALAWAAPTPADLSAPPSFDILPSALQASDGRLWIAWQSNRANPLSFRSDIYYKTLSKGVWSFPVNLTAPGRGNVNNAGPGLAQLLNGTIFLFWVANVTGYYNIYYEKYSGTWSNRVQLTAGSGNDTDPSATVGRDGTLVLTWARKTTTCCASTSEIFYKTLRNNLWSSEVALTSDATLNLWPGITSTNDGRTWVVWSKWLSTGKDYNIFFAVYNGTSWSATMQLVSSSLFDTHPDIAQDRNGTIWLFWARDLPLGSNNFESKLFYKSSVDNGVTWSSDSQMTFDPLCCQIDDNDPTLVQGADHSIWVFYDSNLPTASAISIYYITSSPIFPVHAVTVTKITSSPAQLYPGGLKSIGQSGIVKVNVTVTDIGDYPESVSVSLYGVNRTSYLAGTSLTAPVAVGGSVMFSMTWNTTGAKAARYTLTATASAVPGESLGDISGNSFWARSAVHILPLGDIDQNGNVDIIDASTVALAFGATPGSPHWNVYADINNNAIIDIIDVGVMAVNFGIVT